MAGLTENEVWILLAKYWCDEATTEECFEAEALLKQDKDLQLYFEKLQTVSLVNEYERTGEPVEVFSKLNDRILKSNDG